MFYVLARVPGDSLIFECASGEGNGHALRANGSMPTSERQSGSGSVGESGVGGDRALASAAKDGGRDRTPTKGHYMKVKVIPTNSIILQHDAHLNVQ